MRVDPEHLQEDGLADGAEVPREATPATEPLVGNNGRGCEGWVGRKGDASGIGREDLGVIDLARYPALHESYVLIGGYLDGLHIPVEPGVGVITWSHEMSALCHGSDRDSPHGGHWREG